MTQRSRIGRRPGRLIVYGGGGHGQVVAEAAELAGWRIVGFVDDGVPRGEKIGSWKVVAMPPKPQRGTAVIIGVGDNATRLDLMRRAGATGWKLATVIHPTAWISPSAIVGLGVFIGPRAVVHTAAHVHDGSIINSAAVVEHHCRVGECAHIGPGAVICGRTVVGDLSLVGLNASVLPNLTIGERATIGAGAAVLRDVPDNAVMVGVPARKRG